MTITMEGEADKTKAILKKVRQIEIRTKRKLNSGLSGAYHSIFKGQGIDFEEIREYLPGDDPRAINWNVSAKMHKPFIKKYREDRELTVMLVVDMSLSNTFGSKDKTKQELAAELSSLLAFTADSNQDKVGLLLFTNQLELYLPPRRGRQHILRVIREILFFKPKGSTTHIPHAIEQTTRLLKQQALVFLISDFLMHTHSPGLNALKKALSLAHKKQEWLPIIVADTHEHTLPSGGIMVLEDAETKRILEVNTSCPNIQAAYTQLKQDEQKALKKTFTLCGTDYLEIYTHNNYEVLLTQFFKSRVAKS